MIAITGANGFIGKNLLLSFLEESEILAVDYDHSSIEENKNIALSYPENFLDDLKNKKTNPSFIFHQGACTDTTCYDENYMIRENYIYTVRLINLCMERKIPIIYASSAAVYGDGPFKEGSKRSPKNIYAKSKSLVDDYVSSLLPQNDVQITGLRYFNVYGPGEDRKMHMSSMVNQFKDQILLEKEIKIFENSENYNRDFVYVGDIINVNRHFYKNNISGIFNCGTGIAESFCEIPRVLSNYFNFSTKEIKMPDHLKDKYQKYTKSNNEKLKTIGKYKKSFLTLEEGIENNVKYWEQQGIC